MKLVQIILVIALSMPLWACRTQQQLDKVTLPVSHEGMPGMEYSPTTLIISYDAQVGKQPLLDAIEACGAQVIYDYKMMAGMAIKKPDNMTLDEAIAHFSKVKGVTHVARDHIIRLTDPVKPPVFDR